MQGKNQNKNNNRSRGKSQSRQGRSKKQEQAPKDERDRLNKYIANSGICSRREADEYISCGLVSINDEIVTELGTRVSPGDVVKFNGRRITPEKKVYILMNKPKDVVTTVKDKHAKMTVINLLGDAARHRVYPVGRLDRNTTGVLLLTNDGELTKKLTHPKYKKKKIYQVQLDQPVRKADMEKIAEGFRLHDGFIQADNIEYIDPGDKRQVGIEIHSGQNRIIKRIFEHLGYKVTKLDRVYFAGLTKKGITRGHWRYLKPQEVNRLKMNAFN